MAAKKSGSNRPASDENRRSEQSHEINSPAFPYEADESLHKTYEEYDEDPSPEDPRYEQNLDVDENDTKKRRGQYKNARGQLSKSKQRNTNQRKKK